MIKSVMLDMLRSRGARAGETAEFSWFCFRVCEDDAGALNLETLDFQEMASFTTKFDTVEQIHQQQMQVLAEAGVEAEHCTLRHAAFVDPGYFPGDPDVFLYRVSNADSRSVSAGWAVGLRQNGFSLSRLRKHEPVSLYELSINDSRLTPYWLLPLGWSVVFEDETPILVSPDDSTGDYYEFDDTIPKPWWKFW